MRLTKENKIALDLSVLLTVIGLFLFLPWLVNEKLEITDLKLWVAVDAFVLFLTASFFALNNFARDCTCNFPENYFPENNCADTEKSKILSKKTLLIFLVFLLWGIFVLLLCGLVRMLSQGGESIWAATESIMRSLDSNQYLYIVEHWYTNSGELSTDVSIVFLPGYPVLVKPLYYLIKDSFIAGEIVSITCYALSACFLDLLVKKDMGAESSRRALIFYAIMPGVFFFVAPMSESLFMLTILATIYFVRTKRWTLAGLFGMLSAFTRSSGIFIAIVFVYELALDFLHGEHTKSRFLSALKKLANVFLIPIGLLAYLAVNYAVTGDAFKFLYYQKNHWGQSLGFFFNTVSYMTRYFIENIRQDDINVAVALWGMGLLAIFSLLLLFVFQGKKLRTSYLIYSLVYFAFSMGTTWLLSAPRYAIGMFTLPMLYACATEKKTNEILATLHITALSVVYIFMFVYRWQVW